MKQKHTNPYYELFLAQKENQFVIGNTTYNKRIKILNTLQRAIEKTYRQSIIEALYKDLGKPKVEAEMSEIYQIVGDIKFAKRNLHRWMGTKKVPSPLSMFGTSSYIKHEPKGVCLIISPWNFPFNLTFSPLVSAIAAGNTAIIKPSEMTPNCASLMKEIIETIFEPNHVVLVNGEVETSTRLLELPFNHIFFTGSPNVGKIVMKAASKHLSSVTLELGGKSPTIIDETANLKTAAKKIMWGKYLNCGQVCVSPDYVLIHKSVKEKFIEQCKYWINTYFGDEPEKSDSYGRIVNKKHFDRLVSHLENTPSNAKIIHGGETEPTAKFISPTIVSDLEDNSTLLKEEVFGPILPIVTYDDLEKAVNYINEKERPLALYIYSNSKRNINKIINNTRSGGTCVNNNIVHYANHHLPFGGTNNSGIGKSHGFYGFRAFSNERAIAKQYSYGIAELLFPPYTSYKEWMARFTIKWF